MQLEEALQRERNLQAQLDRANATSAKVESELASLHARAQSCSPPLVATISPRGPVTDLEEVYREDFDDLDWGMGPRVEVCGCSQGIL